MENQKTITANCGSNKSPFHSAGRECFPGWFSCTGMLISTGKKERKKKRFSHNLWTLSSEQSAYSVSCKGRLFQWPLYSGSTTIKASPQKPWPASSPVPMCSTQQTSPQSRPPAPKCSVGRPQQKSSLTHAWKYEQSPFITTLSVPGNWAYISKTWSVI